MVGDKEKEDGIWSVVKDIERYSFFNKGLSLGISYTPKDLSFTDMLLFNWIKEGESGRKN